MNNKGEVKIRDFVIGIFLFLIVSLSLFYFVSDASNYYGAEIGSNVTSSFLGETHSLQDSLKNVTAISNEISGKIQAESNASGILGYGILAGQSTLGAVKLTFASLGIIGDMISILSNFLMIPEWMVSIFITIFAVLLGFLIISAILKWRT